MNMKKLSLFFTSIFSLITIAQNTADVDLTNLGFNGIVKVTTIQPDGKILVGGEFTTFNGVTQNCLIRLNPDGTKDNSFNIGNGFTDIIATQNPNPAHVSVITLQADGKILIGGNFRNFDFYNSRRIVRLNSNGSRDVSFSSGIVGFDGLSSNIGNVMINAIVLQADGKIFVGGNYSGYNGSAQRGLIRLNANGTKDTTFNVSGGPFGGPNGSINCIAIAPSGHIFIGGQYTLYNSLSNSEPNLNLITSDGQDLITLYNANLPTTFIPKTIKVLDEFVNNPTFNLNLYKILVGGDAAPYLAKLAHSGDIETTFSVNNNVSSVTFQENGKVLVSGDFTIFNGASKNRAVCLNSDYSNDTYFNIGTGFDNSVSCIAVQQDGKIWAGGNFTTFNGINSNYSIRLKGETVLSTNNFEHEKISLYPNPTQNNLNFTLSESISVTAYEIHNLLGEKVSYGDLNSNSISVSNLANGVYIIKVKTNEGFLTSKFIKE